MSKLISALVAGSLALAATYAVAVTTERQKDAQLSKMESVGNANAPARGQAIVKSGATADQPMLVEGTTAHERALDKTIASGNADAPARGEAIAKSGVATDQPMALTDTTAHEQTLDKIIASGNANAPARGKAIAQSGQTSGG
jgi:hypothetical protein